jgi:hypothetical protein
MAPLASRPLSGHGLWPLRCWAGAVRSVARAICVGLALNGNRLLLLFSPLKHACGVCPVKAPDPTGVEASAVWNLPTGTFSHTGGQSGFRPLGTGKGG